MSKQTKIGIYDIRDLGEHYDKYPAEPSLCYKIETTDLNHLQNVLFFLCKRGKPNTQHILTIPALSYADEQALINFMGGIKGSFYSHAEGSLLLTVKTPSKILDLSIDSVGQKVTRTPTASPATVPTSRSGSSSDPFNNPSNRPSVFNAIPPSLSQGSTASDLSADGPALPSSQETWDLSQEGSQETLDPSQESTQSDGYSLS